MGEPANPVVIDGADDFGHAGLWVPAGGQVWRAGSVTWIPQQVRAHGVRITPWTGPVAEMPLDSWAYVPGAGLYVNVGGDPSTQDVRVGRRRFGVYLPNRSYIRVEGFTIIRPDDRGIQLNIGSHHNEIVGNVVRWSANIGIQAAGTTDTRNREQPGDGEQRSRHLAHVGKHPVHARGQRVLAQRGPRPAPRERRLPVRLPRNVLIGTAGTTTRTRASRSSRARTT
jgi:hypothetical protein